MFDFYVTLDKHFIEKEIRGKNKNNRANAEHIKSLMSYGNRYPVLSVEGDHLLVPDDAKDLRRLQRQWFKMTGVVKYPNKSN